MAGVQETMQISPLDQGRVSRPTGSGWLSDFQLLQARGRFADADRLEKTIPAEDVPIADPIELMPGEETVFGCIMLQLNLKQGIKKWGKQGADGAMKEMQQMHDMNAFFPRDVKTLTRKLVVFVGV